ncbi:DegV family protein [Vagococcus carniphilus]|uniref:DegV family protein n=1 Tax=Vagococcus carniphilus TaxID=218144 RepID=UPI00288FAD76|nr:DegV family protein [Vagococcus carniphilus]MDT2829668.1 DegV family protein [Vagococcus carniphilus]MDT2839127.1 DegV family protein [Vagococcus carniphilus]MDT2847583.1 DegV family protein [Vagococcus carniphilus]MDT2853185.1 DegV family protein [Vagococcus carniphilus]MDT2865042.1 DegV family protein [Vagococcus carniphilus]
MTNIKIVTDSSCIIDSERMKSIDIHTISLSIMIDGVIYANQNELDSQEFMSMMEKSPSLPKTSQPPIGEFIDLYDELGKDGSEIISIHLTEKLSGTVNTARQAAQMSKSNVTVVDSDYIDQALGFQVYEAAQMAQKGATVEQILAHIEDVKDKTELYIGVATLENLVKGGRIGKMVGAVSGFLNMKVLCELNNGELEVVAKGRGNKTFTKWVKTLEEKLTTYSVNCLGISEADGKDIAEELKASLSKMIPSIDIPIIHTTPLVATHAGKGAFAVMFYTN